MRLLAAALILLLSGCTGGAGLSPYLIQLSDLPGCDYMDLSEGQGADISAEAGLESNPGKVDNDQFEGFGNGSVVDNRVALFDCEDGEALSIALRFDRADATTQFQEMGDCEFLVDGPIVAFFDLDGDMATPENATKVIQGIEQRTGTSFDCGE